MKITKKQNPITQKISLFVLLTLIVVSLSSCDKDKLVSDYEARKNEFIGKWEVTQQRAYFIDGVFQSESESRIEVEFLDEDIYIEESFFGKDTLSWYYQLSPEKLIMTKKVLGNLSNVFEYDVVSITDDFTEVMISSTTISPSFSNPDIIERWEIDREMRKME